MARKSLYVLLVAVMLLAFSVTACAPSGGGSGEAGTAAEMESTTWRMQSPYPAGMSRYICVEAIADRITTITEGKLTVEAHPSGSIVPAYSELEAVAAGTLEMCDNSVQSSAGTLGDWAYFVSGAYPAGPGPMEFIGWYYDGGGIATLEGLVRKTYPDVAPGYLFAHTQAGYGYARSAVLPADFRDGQAVVGIAVRQNQDCPERDG